MSPHDSEKAIPNGSRHPNRRQFLRGACSLAAGLAVTKLSGKAGAEPAAAGGPQGTLPQISLGPHSVSRLVAGGNPPAGGSHQTRLMDMHYREYFTFERTVEFLHRCQAQGINTWQTSNSKKLRDALTRFRDEGGKMQWICLSKPQQVADKNYMDEVLALNPIGIAFHGEVTDVLWREGKIDTVPETLRRIRDAGVCVGLSTHNPAVIQYVEEKGWDADFYMTCVYRKSRSHEELVKLMGEPPIGEVYLRSDLPKMCDVIGKAGKPCLAFKILAAGRTCNTPEQVQRVFEYVLTHIKPTDGVLVGMYPRFTDQVKENADLVRKYG